MTSRRAHHHVNVGSRSSTSLCPSVLLSILVAHYIGLLLVALAAPVSAFSVGGSDRLFRTLSSLSPPCAFHNDKLCSSTKLTLSTTSSDAVTELPDSLSDAAERAAQATFRYLQQQQAPSGARCRVDFDTSAGDETFTLLKTSTEFMQTYVTALCYLVIPHLQQRRQDELGRVAQARVKLQQQQQQQEFQTKKEQEENDTVEQETESVPSFSKQTDEWQAEQERLLEILKTDGACTSAPWEGPKARVYFPDEGNAALARRDWLGMTASSGSNNNNSKGGGGGPLVPPCVEFSSCGGVQPHDVSNDMLVFFFCPKASESEDVEALLLQTETHSPNLKLSVFVNPNLVDMGVTGFGMAGRMLRERLLDNLDTTYYLRTLSWGALTRMWPNAYSVWQEDEGADGGYRLMASLDRLPSNPEVEDIYDVENGLQDGKREGLGLLDSLGDFVNGMMKL